MAIKQVISSAAEVVLRCVIGGRFPLQFVILRAKMPRLRNSRVPERELRLGQGDRVGRDRLAAEGIECFVGRYLNVD